jgi:type VI secretion system Hcp family effector
MPGYINFGHPGESKAADHDAWTDMQSCNFNMLRVIAEGRSGGARQRAGVTFGDICCLVDLDKSTVKVQESMAKGDVLKEVTIDLCTISSEDKPVPYYTIKLKNARITSCSISLPGDDPGGTMVEVSMNFEEITWTYAELDSENKSKGTVEATRKVEEGTA